MRRQAPALLALVALAAGVAGCGGSEQADRTTEFDGTNLSESYASLDPTSPMPDKLIGSSFVAESITEGGQDRPVVEGKAISVEFPRIGAIGASAGCNRIFGPAGAEGDRIVVDLMVTTQMACMPDDLADQEQWLLDFLEAGPSFALDGSHLTLETDYAVVEMVNSEAGDQDNGGEPQGPPPTADPPEVELPETGPPPTADPPEVELPETGPPPTADPPEVELPEPDPPEDDWEDLGPQEALSGSWRVTGLVSGDAITPVMGEANGTVSFTEGRVGFTACNVGGSDIEVAESTIEIDQVIATMRACFGPIQDIESGITAVLDGEISYSIGGDTGDTLHLTHPNGKGLNLRRQS